MFGGGAEKDEDLMTQSLMILRASFHRDVFYIDRQTHSQTHRQTERQTDRWRDMIALWGYSMVSLTIQDENIRAVSRLISLIALITQLIFLIVR